MPEDEFEIYLTLLAKTLRLKDDQRDSIAAELRDHMEARLCELTLQGIEREEAIETALDEFGDASALANDLTQTNPDRQQKRRHIMQTTFGTLAACAAVTFTVMLLTPSNKDGQSIQTSAVAQEGLAEESGMNLGIEEFPMFPEAKPRPALSIRIVDCTEIYKTESGFSDPNQRTADLAHAVEQTISTMHHGSDDVIRAQPFEAFLIITATESAHQQADMLLDQIQGFVAARVAIQREQIEQQREQEHAIARERRTIGLQMTRTLQAMQPINQDINRLQERLRQLTQGPGEEHPEADAIRAKIEERQQELRHLELLQFELELNLESL